MINALTGLLTLSIGAWVACDGGVENRIRQSTPQETAQGSKQAVIDRDWERSFAYLTRGAQETMVGAAYLTAAYGAQTDIAVAESFGALAEKHGLRAEDADLTDHEDLAQLFVEIVDWIEENLPAEHGGTTFATTAERMAVTEFRDFEIDGDRASASRVDPENTRETRFRRIEGRWFIQ